MRTYRHRGLILGVALAAFAACATPGPTPTPVKPGPSPSFVCDGSASVPDFDSVANEIALAAQTPDDETAAALMDQVAAARGGASVIVCVIDLILPDLRSAPVTGVHLEAWEAANADARHAVTKEGRPR